MRTSVGMYSFGTRTLIAAAILATAVLLAARAAAIPRQYIGPHPIDLAGNWHMEAAIHVHDDLPVGLEPFATIGGVHLFLGDPAAYGYLEVPFGYRGAHPLPGGLPGYCSITQPHAHVFAPEGGRYDRDRDGNYVYRGAFRGGLAMLRPRRIAPEPVPGGLPPNAAVTAAVGTFTPSGSYSRSGFGNAAPAYAYPTQTPTSAGPATPPATPPYAPSGYVQRSSFEYDPFPYHGPYTAPVFDGNAYVTSTRRYAPAYGYTSGGRYPTYTVPNPPARMTPVPPAPLPVHGVPPTHDTQWLQPAVEHPVPPVPPASFPPNPPTPVPVAPPAAMAPVR